MNIPLRTNYQGEVAVAVTSAGEAIPFGKTIYLWCVEQYGSGGREPEWAASNYGIPSVPGDTSFDVLARLASRATRIWAEAYRSCIEKDLHHYPGLYAAEYVGVYWWTPSPDQVSDILGLY